MVTSFLKFPFYRLRGMGLGNVELFLAFLLFHGSQREGLHLPRIRHLTPAGAFSVETPKPPPKLHPETRHSQTQL